MGRLIDEDALIKHFETIQKQEDAIGLDFVAIADEIKAQPTAYDLDKVVKQLEGFREEMEQFGCSGMLSDMIEVVRGGEVDGGK